MLLPSFVFFFFFFFFGGGGGGGGGQANIIGKHLKKHVLKIYVINEDNYIKCMLSTDIILLTFKSDIFFCICLMRDVFLYYPPFCMDNI